MIQKVESRSYLRELILDYLYDIETLYISNVPVPVPIAPRRESQTQLP